MVRCYRCGGHGWIVNQTINGMGRVWMPQPNNQRDTLERLLPGELSRSGKPCDLCHGTGELK